ncbi:hypothetical protein CRENPOLYSF1_10027 [Crenothrix polyspora]|jgi:hypothetical protein|uniref:Uncharacterized protein n=1 Tax=Crenothrix polyspora TaxID=360316 RepID=A0A1R4GYG3_9GAMM|nr:hypothetical protein CRENPOLYSF1_10027 [Crenothrix polyspora]
MTPVHMHDQVRNRVDNIMMEPKTINWDEVMQNVITLGILSLFFMCNLPI